MAGHSKWKNIRLRKGKQDAVRGKLFTKLAKEIIIAAREGGGNPDANLRLKIAINKAKENSMPADNIKRAIGRGTGEIEGGILEELTYEGYGPGGTAVMVQCVTDNRNRTVPELRHAFGKCGGSLGENGSVAWQFKPQGQIIVKADGMDEDAMMNIALEAGADDVRADEETYEVITSFEAFSEVRQNLENAKVTMESAEIVMAPTNTVELSADDAAKMLRLMDMLEELDDVQNVYANFDIPDEVMQAVEG